MRTFALLSASAALLPTVLGYGYVLKNPGDISTYPKTSEKGQTGTNKCGTKDSTTAKCQSLFLNSLTDFCLWGPPTTQVVGDAEEVMVSYCTAAGHGSRLMPKGTITGAHMIETPHYIQYTGTGDFTKIHIPKGDEGGELDPHGATGNGNPIGALVVAKLNGVPTQILEWTQFISYNEFCIRICKPGPDAWKWCNHIYDVMGCYWNEPGNYKKGSFDTCKADDVAMPMGQYKLANGKTSTWHQGVKPTPSAQAPAKSSSCSSIKTIPVASYPTTKPKAKRHEEAAH